MQAVTTLINTRSLGRLTPEVGLTVVINLSVTLRKVRT